jgi:hypothetical protein
MAKVTFTMNLNTIKKLDNLVNDKLAEDIGTMMVQESKRMIASGQSPVKGVGRFAAYKNPESYPGNRKAARPVNLSLTGTMLSYLGYRKVGKTIEVGILPGAPRKVQTIARVHNTGERSDIPQRQFIPMKGQDFVASISIKMRELFRKRVLELIKG